MNIQLLITIVLGLVTAVLVPACGWLISYSLATRERVAALETEVAKTYATNAYVGEVETRLGSALKDINAKLDRLVDRLLSKD